MRIFFGLPPSRKRTLLCAENADPICGIYFFKNLFTMSHKWVLSNASQNKKVALRDLFVLCKDYEKDIFAVCNKDLNSSNVNEIVRCTMKSSLGSDEIFSLRLQMKSNPPIFCRKADFIAKRFHPPQVDLFRRRRI